MNANLNANRVEKSLNDLMSGKRLCRKLPDNFFEKVVEEELTLKRHFTIESLQSLVDLYSV